jgi:hypothetical protein
MEQYCQEYEEDYAQFIHEKMVEKLCGETNGLYDPTQWKYGMTRVTTV